MTEDRMTANDLAQLVEFSEANAYTSLIGSVGEDEASRLGFRVVNVGTGVAVIADSISTSLILNRVLGLGLREPLSEAVLDEAIGLYAGSKVAFAIELSPQARPDKIKQWLRSRRIRSGIKSAVLCHDLKEIPTVPSDLRIEVVGSEHADELARICTDVFGMPSECEVLLASAHKEPGWRQWMGFDGDAIAGAALSFVRDGVAWSGWAATLPEFRGRRFHASYLAMALQEAKDSGCEWFTAETAIGTADQPDPAYRNLLRLGFELVYERPTYVGQPQR